MTLAEKRSKQLDWKSIYNQMLPGTGNIMVPKGIHQEIMEYTRTNIDSLGKSISQEVQKEVGNLVLIRKSLPGNWTACLWEEPNYYSVTEFGWIRFWVDKSLEVVIRTAVLLHPDKTILVDPVHGAHSKVTPSRILIPGLTTGNHPSLYFHDNNPVPWDIKYYNLEKNFLEHICLDSYYDRNKFSELVESICSNGFAIRFPAATGKKIMNL